MKLKKASCSELETGACCSAEHTEQSEQCHHVDQTFFSEINFAEVPADDIFPGLEALDIQVVILFLLEAYSCDARTSIANGLAKETDPKNNGSHKIQCNHPTCPAMTAALIHWRECVHSPNFDAMCLEVKQAIRHWDLCIDSQCIICQPLRLQCSHFKPFNEFIRQQNTIQQRIQQRIAQLKANSGDANEEQAIIHWWNGCADDYCQSCATFGKLFPPLAAMKNLLFNRLPGASLRERIKSKMNDHFCQNQTNLMGEWVEYLAFHEAGGQTGVPYLIYVTEKFIKFL